MPWKQRLCLVIYHFYHMPSTKAPKYLSNEWVWDPRHLALDSTCLSLIAPYPLISKLQSVKDFQFPQKSTLFYISGRCTTLPSTFSTSNLTMFTFPFVPSDHMPSFKIPLLLTLLAAFLTLGKNQPFFLLCPNLYSSYSILNPKCIYLFTYLTEIFL